MKRVFVFVLILLSFNLVSAGFFGSITGMVISEEVLASGNLSELSCSDFSQTFEDSGELSIPSGIPFSDEVFNIYLDEEFFASVVLDNKVFTGVTCEDLSEATYNVYLTSGLILDSVENYETINFADYYNEKKASGDLKIEAVGFGKSVKLAIANTGLKIASWFS